MVRAGEGPSSVFSGTRLGARDEVVPLGLREWPVPAAGVLRGVLGVD